MESIVLDGVVKEFASGFRAVDNVNLTVDEGEFLVLVGPSGCGKSTLLRLIAGLERPTSGSIRIAGRDVTKLMPGARDIAMVFQNYALYPHMTVRKNIAYGLKVRGMAKRDIERTVAEVARLLDVQELLDRRPESLSGGQRQRVAMGRAIARKPSVYLMDEPLSNLDARLRVSMRAELDALHKRLGVATVYVTHDQVEAMTLGQRAAVMRAGVIQQLDTPQALYNDPNSAFVAAFIGSPPMNFARARLDGDEIAFAGFRISVPAALRPAVSSDTEFALGIRPESFVSAHQAPSDWPRIDVEVSVREDLGHETLVFFPVAAPPLAFADVRQVLDDPSEQDGLLTRDQRALFCCRLGSDSAGAEAGIKLAINPHGLRYFALESGERLAGQRSSVAGAS